MLKQAGLTLIEVLIALAIMGIALTAAIKATTQTTHSTAYLQDKIIATWVGENVLNEVATGVLKLSKEQQRTSFKTNMLGRDWYWRAAQEETANHRIEKISVSVSAHENDDENQDEDTNTFGLVNLETYVYHSD